VARPTLWPDHRSTTERWRSATGRRFSQALQGCPANLRNAVTTQVTMMAGQFPEPDALPWVATLAASILNISPVLGRV